MFKAALIVLPVIVCPLLWMMIIVPLIGKFFGVPIKMGALPIVRLHRRISKRQSFWFAGVLGWGIGLFLLGTLGARFLDDRRPTILEDSLGFILVVVFGGLLSQEQCTYPIDKAG